jgi:hypothetical protein
MLLQELQLCGGTRPRSMDVVSCCNFRTRVICDSPLCYARYFAQRLLVRRWFELEAADVITGAATLWGHETQVNGCGQLLQFQNACHVFTPFQ